jgi:hypothetical protein
VLLQQLALRGQLLAEREEQLAGVEARHVANAQAQRAMVHAALARWGVAGSRRRLLAQCMRALALNAAAGALRKDRVRFIEMLQNDEPTKKTGSTPVSTPVCPPV